MLARSRAFRWRQLSAAVAGLLTAFALLAVGQPPIDEKELSPEELKQFKDKLKRFPVEEDPIVVKSKASDITFGNPPDVKLDELARAAEEAKYPAFKDLYVKHTVPFDRLTLKGTANRFKPIPLHRTEKFPKDTESGTIAYGLQEVRADGTIGPPVRADGVPDRIEYFEEAALKAGNDLLGLKPFGTGAAPGGWTIPEQLAVAERLMAAALRFHDYARENPRDRPLRKGRVWDDVRKPLADRLREVRLLLLQNAVTVGDWDRAREAGSQLMAAYPKDSTVAAEVAKARVLEADRLLKSEKHFDHVKAKDLLDEFEARYPGGGGDAVKALRARIATLAQNAFQRAKDKKAVNDLVTARDAVTQAAALDPTIPGVRELQRELKAGYQTLYVGVRDFPRTMSPITARFDSEKQVVELLFEGLLSEIPDEVSGTRYKPGAAVNMPAVVIGGREFLLRTQERDASGRYGFASHDVVSTVKMLQTKSETWGAYALPWIDDLPTPRDTTGVRVGFKQGHPDPRALLTFKLLPASWLESNNKLIDDVGFAEKPYGTGPFKFSYSSRTDGSAPREMVFVDNPLYSRWRDRANQPLIKEVRMVEVAKVYNLVEAFQQGSLHVLPDVPTGDLDKFRNALGARVEVVTATTNRRVHLIAVNHRRPQMRSKALRQGLMMAIDREAVLHEVFRAGKPEFHKAMNGPFPPTSWAAAKGPSGSQPLVNRDLAVTRLQTYLGESAAKREVTLLYPDGDPQAAKACKAIQKQVEDLFKDSSKKLSVVLEAVPLRELLERVEDEHRYDLAYVPFDYPDDWYPYALGAMLDPQAATRGGRNWFGFLSKDASADESDVRLGQLLNELRAYREFGQLSTRAAEVHKQFNECVPFIPLWQLDRHMLVHNAVKVVVDDSDQQVSPRVLNPTTLFQGIARWRLE